MKITQKVNPHQKSYWRELTLLESEKWNPILVTIFLVTRKVTGDVKNRSWRISFVFVVSFKLI